MKILAIAMLTAFAGKLKRGKMRPMPFGKVEIVIILEKLFCHAKSMQHF